MPAEWTEDHVRATWGWYQDGIKLGERLGRIDGRNEVSNAVSTLRSLGIGTVLLPNADAA
jgi:hypothetical protein